jgi:hypothetical protein
MTNSFEKYLIMIGIRSFDFTYTDAELFDNTVYFLKCFKSDLSAYKALLFLHDYLRGDYLI